MNTNTTNDNNLYRGYQCHKKWFSEGPQINLM